MKLIDNTLFADPGHTLVRVADGFVAGDRITLGKSWYMNGELLSEPITEIPEYYEQRPATPDELAARFDIQPLLDAVSDRVELKIKSEFRFRGIPLWLSMEQQLNIRAALDSARISAGKSLPEQFKAGHEKSPRYITINSVAELEDLYSAATSHIRTTLARGWQIKDIITARRWSEIPQWLTDQFPQIKSFLPPLTSNP